MIQLSNSNGRPNALARWKLLIFLVSACQTPATVSPKKRKNNRGKAEDVASSETENSDPKQRLSFAEQDSTCMLLQTNIELLFNVYHTVIVIFFGEFGFQWWCLLWGTGSLSCHNLLNWIIVKQFMKLVVIVYKHGHYANWTLKLLTGSLQQLSDCFCLIDQLKS